MPRHIVQARAADCLRVKLARQLSNFFAFVVVANVATTATPPSDQQTLGDERSKRNPPIGRENVCQH